MGSFSIKTAKEYNLSGVLLRSTGEKFDIRLSKNDTYANYFYINFNSYTGSKGDCYDRYLIRINEMVESLQIINQSVNNFLLNPAIDKLDTEVNNPYKNMESLIQHFKYWSEGFNVTANKIYTPVESPKGEFGVMLFSDGTSKPFRCKIRSPAYFSTQFLPKMVRGHFLADLVALIGTIDIVFGEVDR